jgi:DNA-binding CsgD family transcriptional regulator
VQLCDAERSERWLATGITYSTEHDLDAWRLYMLGWRAWASLQRGRFDAAAADAAHILAHARVSVISRINALVVSGLVRARRGDPEVWPQLDAAAALADATGELQRIGPARAARAEAAWWEGDAARAVSEAEPAFRMACQKRDAWLAGWLGNWCQRAGLAVELPPWVAPVYAVAAAGDWHEAARRWHAASCPFEAALSLSDGDAAAQRRALAGFESMHARPAAAWVGRRLRQRGARAPRPSTRAHPAGLTRRETDVLRLVAAGMRDQEIASRLFLAPKTVGHHVSHILRKLGVHSRTAAAQRLAAFDAQTPAPQPGEPRPK